LKFDTYEIFPDGQDGAESKLTLDAPCLSTLDTRVYMCSKQMFECVHAFIGGLSDGHLIDH